MADAMPNDAPKKAVTYYKAPKMDLETLKVSQTSSSSAGAGSGTVLCLCVHICVS